MLLWELQARYGWDHEPRSYHMPRPKQAETLFRRGATVTEIAVLMDILPECASHYLRKTGCLPTRPDVRRGRETGRQGWRRVDHIRSRMVVSALDVIDDAKLAEAEARWSLGAHVWNAVRSGATRVEIARHLGLSTPRLQQLLQDYLLRQERGARSPLERALDTSDVAKNWRVRNWLLARTRGHAPRMEVWC